MVLLLLAGLLLSGQKEQPELHSKTYPSITNHLKIISMDGKSIDTIHEKAQKELAKTEEDLLKPIQEKVRASITKVGKAKGYQYVVDGSSLLLADGPDLTADVKKDLGF